MRLCRSILAASFLLLPAAAMAGSIEGKVTAPDRRDHPLVVYVEKGPPAPAAPSPERARVGQKGATFTPGSVVVPLGGTVEFPNFDKIYHNVFSLAPGNEFDLGLYRGGVSKSATFGSPGEVDVFCNIHPDMHARVLVVPSPQYASVDEKGAFRIADLKPGEYTVVAWSPAHEPQRKTIIVKEGAATADFTLEPRRFPNTPHLNKHGEQYGRYK